MCVYLINPTSEKRNWGNAFPPLGLCYVARQYENIGEKVVIIDRDEMMAKCGDIAKVDTFMLVELFHSKPDVVGISATTPLIPDAYHVAKMVKKYFPDCKIVLGGPHVTVLP